MQYLEEHRGLVTTALVLLAAGLVGVELGLTSARRYLANHPAILEIGTSVLVLAATYLVIEEVVTRRDSARWKRATGPALSELHTAVNALDGAVYAWCLDNAPRLGMQPPCGADPRETRNAFVEASLCDVAEDKGSYAQFGGSPNGCIDANNRLSVAYRSWVSLLVQNRELQELALRLPRLLRNAGSVVAAMDACEQELTDQGETQRGITVFRAWNGYQRERDRVTAELRKHR